MSNEFYKASKGLTFSRRILRLELKSFNARCASAQGYSTTEVNRAVNRIGYSRGARFGSIFLLGTVFDHGYDFMGFFAKYAY